MTYLDGLFDFKYFCLRANSITTYEHIIKVPASVTLDDIQKLEAKDHHMFQGEHFTDVERHPFNTSGDWQSEEHWEIDKPDDYEKKHATEYSLEDLKIDKEEN